MDISQKALQTFQDKFAQNSPNASKYKVMQGVLRKARITNVSVNQNTASKQPFKFNFTVPGDVKATDQKYSGRCWIFAGLNLIRRKLITKYKLEGDFELSQAYIHRWDKLEKCNAALEVMYDLAKQGHGNESLHYSTLIPIMLGDGGTWGMFVKLVKKYGVLPKDVYPDTQQAANTNQMNHMLQITVMKASATIHLKMDMDIDVFRKYKQTVLDECYRIINICLGNAPSTFAWTFHETKQTMQYTPKQFYNKVVKSQIDVTKFVSICNVPQESYNRLLAVEYLHNVLEKDDDIKRTLTNWYLNLDINTFKQCVWKSINHQTAVWFACDVGHYWLNHGTLLDPNASNIKDMFDIDFSLSKRSSLETRTNVANHAMCITGCQKEKEAFTRWKVENSHGIASDLKGFITMSDEYFSQYVLCAAVPIDCIPPKLRNLVRKKTSIKWFPYYSVLGTFSDSPVPALAY